MLAFQFAVETGVCHVRGREVNALTILAGLRCEWERVCERLEGDRPSLVLPLRGSK